MKICSSESYYFMCCISADKIAVAENRMLTINIVNCFYCLPFLHLQNMYFLCAKKRFYRSNKYVFNAVLI